MKVSLGWRCELRLVSQRAAASLIKLGNEVDLVRLTLTHMLGQGYLHRVSRRRFFREGEGDAQNQRGMHDNRQEHRETQAVYGADGRTCNGWPRLGKNGVSRDRHGKAFR